MEQQRLVLMQTANKLKEVLTNFGVKVEVTNVSKGPSVTRYELQPEMGTKVSRDNSVWQMISSLIPGSSRY